MSNTGDNNRDHQHPNGPFGTSLSHPNNNSNQQGSSFPALPFARLANVNLFEVALGSLDHVPHLEANTAAGYQEWKPKLKEWALAKGVWDLLTTPYEEMQEKANSFLSDYGFNPWQSKE